MFALDLQTFYYYVAHSAHKGRQDWLSPPCGFPRAAWHLGRKSVAFATSDDSQGFLQIPFQRYHCWQYEWVKGDLNALAVLCCHVGRRAQPHHQPWTFQLVFKKQQLLSNIHSQGFPGEDHSRLFGTIQRTKETLAEPSASKSQTET